MSKATATPSRATSVRGVQRIVDSNRDVSYKAQIRRSGHPYECKRFATLDDAAKWKRGRESEIDRGIFVDRREAAKFTVGDLFKKYRLEVTPNKRGKVVETARLLKLEEDPLAKVNAALVQAHHLNDWMERRAKQPGRGNGTISGSTINRDLALISHVFTKAAKAWRMYIDNPVEFVERPRASKPRDRRLSAVEVDAICAASSSPKLPIVLRLAVETGMRLGELLALTWEAIDLDARFVHLDLTKNGDERRVPLNASAVAELTALPRPIKGGQVFKVKPQSMSRSMRRATDRARRRYEADCQTRGIAADPKFLRGARLHDGRHETVSRLVEAGVDQLTTAKIVGHKTLAMTNRYFTARDGHLLAAVDAAAAQASVAR